MRYMIIRKADRDTEAGVMPGEALIAAMGRYNQQLVDAGVMRAGDGLKPSSQGVRLRLSDGRAIVVDGPFAETKELVAGFSIFEAPSMQAVLDWVARWPSEDGDVELEVREMGCPGGCAEVAGTPSAALTGRRFVVLLRSSALTETDQAPPQHRLDALDAFNQAEAAAGVLLAGDGLKSSARGARVTFNGGKAALVDGPFTEIKELIAGYWMIRAASLAEAVEWAKRVPYPTGPEVEVEIRPTYEIEDFGVEFTAELQEAEQRMRAQQLESGMRAQLAGKPQARR
jgi:hypothetical protein